jgi:hypothetical protein
VARWTLPVALACIAAADVSAQDARTVLQNRRLSEPAAFTTDHCVAKVTIDNRERSLTLPGASDAISVRIDNQYSLTLRSLPKAQRDTYSVTFAPHYFLCDGKTHQVEVSWKGVRPMTHQVQFPANRSNRPW